MILANHFVVFVDLLGQSQRLERFTRLPTTDTERQEVSALMRETGGVVRNVRHSFNEWVERAKVTPQSALEKVAPERRDEFKKIRSFRLSQAGFSDCFVISTSLGHDNAEGRSVWQARVAHELQSTFTGLATLFLRALAQGIPLRAGIDIGLAMDISPNEIYGPALLSAYRLETEVAEYPRAVIGEGVLKFLAWVEGTQSEPLDRFSAEMIRQCREFICEAPDDRCPMLHLLSPVISKFLETYDADVAAAHEFVRREIQIRTESHDHKLRSRYERLARYFETFGAVNRPPTGAQ